MKNLVMLALCCSLALPLAARASDLIPLFSVGTAVVDITPSADHPQYLGGYDAMDAPTANAHDPLQVRAFFVRRGTSAVAFAIVDSQGWFAGYQEGPYGVTDARETAALMLSEEGLSMSPGDIIVSSTHSHAAPTIMGIWGPTDPYYLKRVHDAAVQAILDASTHTHQAELWTGSGSIAGIIAHTVEGTDHYDGWSIDDDTPYLWAREPGTGATLGFYVDVPVHPDTFRGSKYNQMSADHPGFVRARLDALLGGTAVVAMGTLGRQETIGGRNDANEVARDATYQTNRILRGMTNARPIIDSTVGGAEQYILTPATNPALLGLVYANNVSFQCVDGVACTIDRSIEPPYLAGNMIGTWVTMIRIGDVVWASEPGEAFPEVAEAIRASVTGASAVHVVGMAQDQLGYFYPPEDYPSTELNPSDFLIYNVGPALADQTVQAAALNATLLGFPSVPRHPRMANDEPHRYFEPGVQFFPVVPQSSARTVSFTTSAKGSQSPVLASGSVSDVTWTFPDGTLTTDGDAEFDHAFPGAGSYLVTASVNDGAGNTRTYSDTVVIDLVPTATITFDGQRLIAGISGGDGSVLAAHWTFSDGSSADGLTIHHEPGVTATVTIVDGSGDTATTALAY